MPTLIAKFCKECKPSRESGKGFEGDKLKCPGCGKEWSFAPAYARMVMEAGNERD